MSIIKTIQRVIKSGQFILGKECEALEKEVSEYIGVDYAASCNSGADALYLCLKALDITGEVITTPFTFVATAESIARAGATPVFVDIQEDGNINADLIEKAITVDTQAIMPVDLFGKLCDMQKIMKLARKYKLKVIEDSAQAFGTEGVGYGDCAIFSFFPTKILGCYGDGGMVISKQKWIIDKIKKMRNHGSSSTDKYLHEFAGINSRLDEIQAAILREKLKTFDKDKKKHKYQEGRYYPLPLHLQPCFKYLGYHRGDFPIAEKKAKEIKSYKKNV